MIKFILKLFNAKYKILNSLIYFKTQNAFIVFFKVSKQFLKMKCYANLYFA